VYRVLTSSDFYEWTQCEASLTPKQLVHNSSLKFVSHSDDVTRSDAEKILSMVPYVASCMDVAESTNQPIILKYRSKRMGNHRVQGFVEEACENV